MQPFVNLSNKINEQINHNKTINTTHTNILFWNTYCNIAFIVKEGIMQYKINSIAYKAKYKVIL